mmetsp:Transcript_11796/g.27695  ORF Transcript_11796/g.27695 Transcript_11796/m.27695 type:complete len:608 (+) Transcript_11796:97-1920(+)
MSAEFDPEAVLSTKRFGSVTILQTPSKLFYFNLRINGEPYYTPSFRNKSDLLYFVDRLQLKCAHVEHLKMNSQFESPITSHDKWVETRTVELETRDRERQEDEEEQEESPAEGSAEEDPDTAAALSIAKKLAASVNELVSQTAFGRAQDEQAKNEGYQDFPYLKSGVTFPLVLALVSGAAAMLPDLEDIKKLSETDRKKISEVLIAVVKRLAGFYPDPNAKPESDSKADPNQDAESSDKNDRDGGDEYAYAPKQPNFYWMGVNLGMYMKAFPSLMKPLVDCMEDLLPRERDEFIAYLYVIGFIDGDGSWFGKFDGGDMMECSISVGAQTSFYDYLCANGFRKNGKSQVWTNLDKESMSSPLMVNAYQGSALKSSQARTISRTSSSTCPLANNERVTSSRQLVSRRLSIWNTLHGQGYSKEYFVDKILTPSMKRKDRVRYLSTMMYLAGVMGADGTVGSGPYANQTLLTQSCLNFQLAFAEVMSMVHGWEDPVVVRPAHKQAAHDRKCSGNTRREFVTAFSVEQVEHMCLTLGALDHSRSLQWLLTLITRIVTRCKDKDVPNRWQLLRFLRLILIVIRIWIPSPGYWKTVAILEVQVDRFLQNMRTFR